MGAPLTLRGAQAYRTDAEILTPEACCAACTADPKCRAWVLESMTSAKPPTCRLKASAGAAFACPLCPFGASLGPPPAPPPPACPAQQPKPKPPSPPAPSQQPAAGSKPHVLMFLQDVRAARPPFALFAAAAKAPGCLGVQDLGHDDVAFNGNSVNLDITGNITAAAREGIVLDRHCAHRPAPRRKTWPSA